MSWSTTDARATDPQAGHTGHFAHHTWAKEGLIDLDARVKDLLARVAHLETQVAALSAAKTP